VHVVQNTIKISNKTQSYIPRSQYNLSVQPTTASTVSGRFQYLGEDQIGQGQLERHSQKRPTKSWVTWEETEAVALAGMSGIGVWLSGLYLQFCWHITVTAMLNTGARVYGQPLDSRSRLCCAQAAGVLKVSRCPAYSAYLIGAKCAGKQDAVKITLFCFDADCKQSTYVNITSSTSNK